MYISQAFARRNALRRVFHIYTEACGAVFLLAVALVEFAISFALPARAFAPFARGAAGVFALVAILIGVWVYRQARKSGVL